MQIIAVAERGREESDIKSERVSSSKERNYELAKLGKKLVTRNLPGWIYLDQKGKMQIDPAKAETGEGNLRNAPCWSHISGYCRDYD
jgi:hypothetical protein